MIFKKLRTINNKTPLLITPHPKENEIFSSWFVRISYAHHTHPNSFFSLLFGKKNRGIVNSDIDIVLPNTLLLHLESLLTYSPNLYNMTLQPYSGYLQEGTIKNGNQRFISHIKFCPLCLKNDKIPYFRFTWKFTFYNVCLEHKIFLHDKCPRCNKKLNILQMFHNQLPFTYCHSCGFDLRKAKTTKISPNYFYGIKAMKNISNIANNGYLKIGESFIYSFCFFDVIVQLTKLIINKKKLKYINEHHLYRILRPIFKQKINTNAPIYKQLNVKQNFALFGLIFFLFEKFPTNMSSYMTYNKLTHWDMMQHIRYISFWWDTSINAIIPRYIPSSHFITKKEVIEGKKYLKKQGYIINQANLTRLFKCNFTSRDNKLRTYI